MSMASGLVPLTVSSPPETTPVLIVAEETSNTSMFGDPTDTRNASVSRWIQYSPSSAQKSSTPAPVVRRGLGRATVPVTSVHGGASALDVRGKTLAGTLVAIGRSGSQTGQFPTTVPARI